jgi:hypothetical protein
MLQVQDQQDVLLPLQNATLRDQVEGTPAAELADLAAKREELLKQVRGAEGAGELRYM